MSLWMIQTVLILAPLMLGLSIGAYWRLRRHVCDAKPVAVFWQHRWNAVLILIGGLVLFRGAAISGGVGLVPQMFGFLLSLEFFYIAYANIRVIMSGRGFLMGMRFMPWQRFSGYAWKTDSQLELTTRFRRYRLRVPAQLKAPVQEIVDLHILK